MQNLNDLIATEVLCRAAGEGEITVTHHVREDGSTYVIAQRPGGFWGAATIEAVAKGIVGSLFNDLRGMSQDQIAVEFGFIDPRETGRIGGMKGGRATTEAKKAASAENGKRGGRPRKIKSE